MVLVLGGEWCLSFMENSFSNLDPTAQFHLALKVSWGFEDENNRRPEIELTKLLTLLKSKGFGEPLVFVRIFLEPSTVCLEFLNQKKFKYRCKVHVT